MVIISGVSEKQSRAILEAVARAAKLSDDELPTRDRNERPDAQLDAVAGLLGVVANARAADHDISRTYLVARDDLFQLAAWWLRRDESAPPEMPLLTDWRRELLGQELLDLLDGKLSLVFDKTPNPPAIKVRGAEHRVLEMCAKESWLRRCKRFACFSTGAKSRSMAWRRFRKAGALWFRCAAFLKRWALTSSSMRRRN